MANTYAGEATASLYSGFNGGEDYAVLATGQEILSSFFAASWHSEQPHNFFYSYKFELSEAEITAERPGMVQTFADEFDDFAVTPSGLNAQGEPVWRSMFRWDDRTLPNNKEAEYYSDHTTGTNPFSVADGILTITAAPNDNLPDGLTYTSGLITTMESFNQEYGYFEARMKLPDADGMWPAFWLLPSDASWPPELDVMEQLGKDPGTIYTTAHSKATGQHTSTTDNTKIDSTEWHTYAASWEPEVITFYIDDEEVWQTPTPPDMHKPMYMLANLAVGDVGSWPGPANGETAQMQIDYIRAYQFDEFV